VTVASQRITVAKIGGVSADVVEQRLREWSAARRTDEPDEWSSEQWPEDVRKQADDFADRLRAHALAPPVVHYVEWSDMWSGGDLFGRWLKPSDNLMPLAVYANQYEIFGYALPDGGGLSRHLAAPGPQQWEVSDWFVGRLREAVGAWQELVERAVVIVLRQVVQGSVLDEEVTASLKCLPDWLS
jgi:hypothetical protein